MSLQNDDNNPDLSKEVEASLKKLHIKDVDILKPLRPEELLYLLDHCPFLQLIARGDSLPLENPEFITARSGWAIHNYGDAMSSSPGELLFAGGDFRISLNDDAGDNSESGPINTGKGTIVKQAFDTAAEMIEFAKKLGWAGAQLIDGHPLMAWAAWMKASDEHFSLEGYEPTEKDLKKRERVKRSEIQDLMQTDFRPTQG